MVEYLSIHSGTRLEGRVQIAGAKNASLPLLIAALLTREECVLRNVPDLEDIAVTLRLLKSLGAEVRYSDSEVRISTPQVTSSEARYGLVKALRASFWVLGPLLARLGQARVALPGGDAIGTRPVDLHLKGLVQMGADIRMQHGVITAHAPGGLYPQKIQLDFPSVGATHHLMMTAALVKGETVIEGAAREPEVVELGRFLQGMGAHIEGLGTSTIRLVGREELGGAQVDILGDRIEAATYLIAGAMTGGRVAVRGIKRGSLRSTLNVLEQAGCNVYEEADTVTVAANRRLHAVSFTTAPYPGLATDVQPLLMAAMTRAEGTSVITESVFDNRFGHVAEYRRLGANISLNGRLATVTGVSHLSGAPVEGSDIRAAAGLVIMGLAADGITELYEIHHLDRGYESLIEKFQVLGAQIARVPIHDEKEVVFGC